MKRLQQLERKLRSLAALGRAVAAMKGLSAHHFRAVRSAVEPARKYRLGVERALASCGEILPPRDGQSGLIVIGSDLGLCGGYNARVVALAVERRAAIGPGPTLCVGRRARALLSRNRVEVQETYQAPASAHGITDILLRIVEDILILYVRGMPSFEVVSSRFEGVGHVAPVATRVLPLHVETGPTGPVPRYVSKRHFEDVVAREFLFVSLFDLLLDAIASEQGARIVATQAAQEWLEHQTQKVRAQLASSRREESTQETVEIALAARG